MKTDKITIQGFVTKWDEKSVWFHCLEPPENIVADRKPLFEGMKLFKGKNFVWEIVAVPGSSVCTCKESKKTKIIQLWNYYKALQKIKQQIKL